MERTLERGIQHAEPHCPAYAGCALLLKICSQHSEKTHLDPFVQCQDHSSTSKLAVGPTSPINNHALNNRDIHQNPPSFIFSGSSWGRTLRPLSWAPECTQEVADGCWPGSEATFWPRTSPWLLLRRDSSWTQRHSPPNATVKSCHWKNNYPVNEFTPMEEEPSSSLKGIPFAIIYRQS